MGKKKPHQKIQPLRRFKKRAFMVSAQLLESSVRVETTDGLVLLGKEGEWMIVADDGGISFLPADVFEEMYEACDPNSSLS